jgi:hypothetical protein
MAGGMNLHIGRGGSSTLGETTFPDETRTGKTSLLTGETHPYGKSQPRHGLPEIVRAFKSFSARRINRLRRTEGIPVWQRNYYEHIIRNELEMDRITRYIESNPSRWMDDAENPMKFKP